MLREQEWQGGVRRGLLNKRRDANEPGIVAALRAVGATVEQLSLADGPDLLVGFAGENFLLEVKTAKGKLKPGQVKWQEQWHGASYVARSPLEALSILGFATAREAIGVKARRMA